MIEELQNNINDIKDKIFEIIVEDLSNPNQPIPESKSKLLSIITKKNRDNAYKWLEKATDSLTMASHYLENYEEIVG